MQLNRTMLASALLCGALTAQNPCWQNLVTNGDFEQVLPLWSVAGSVTATFPATNVNGVATTRALELSSISGIATATAPGPLSLGAGTYEFSMDVMRVPTFSTATFDVGLTTGTTRVSIGTVSMNRRIGVGFTSRARVAFLFTPPAAGSHTLDVQVTSGDTITLDNVAVHEGRLPLFNFDHDWRAVNQTTSWVVEAMPNQFVGVFLSDRFISTPVSIPGCSGEVLLGPSPLILVIDLISTGTNGLATGTLPIPAALSGAPLYWQGIALTPGCSLGCADLIAFR